MDLSPIECSLLMEAEPRDLKPGITIENRQGSRGRQVVFCAGGDDFARVSHGIVGGANLLIDASLSDEARSGAVAVLKWIAANVAERKRKGATEREKVLTAFAIPPKPKR